MGSSPAEVPLLSSGGSAVSTPRSFTIFLTAIFGAGLMLFARLDNLYEIGSLNDDALYLVVAKHMWQTAGPGQLLGIKPDFPLPGLPLILAPLTSLTTERMELLEWMPILFSGAAVLTFGFWARHRLTAAEALMATALLALNPIVAQLSGWLMPAPFLMFNVITCFMLLDRLVTFRSKACAVTLGLGMGWAMLTRVEGIVLVVSIVTAMAFDRPLRSVIWWVLAPVLGAGGFSAYWFLSNDAVSTEYGADVMALLGHWLEHPGAVLPESFRLVKSLVVSSNVLFLGTTFTSGLAEAALSATILACIPVGFIAFWKGDHRRRPVIAAILGFCLLKFCVHVFWRVDHPRYFLPLFPPITLFVVRGLIATTARIRAPLLGTGLIALVILSQTLGNYSALALAARGETRFNAAPTNTIARLKKSASPSARIMSNIAPAVELFSDLQSVMLPRASNHEELYYIILRHEVEFLALRFSRLISTGADITLDPNAVARQCRDIARQHPDHFQLEYTNPVEETEIYRIVPQPGFLESFSAYLAAIDALGQGKIDAAFQEAERCVTLFPQTAIGNNLLAALLLSKDRIGEATPFLTRALELDPSSPQAILNLATVYRRLGAMPQLNELLHQGVARNRANGREDEFMRHYREVVGSWHVAHWKFLVFQPSTHSYKHLRFGTEKAARTKT